MPIIDEGIRLLISDLQNTDISENELVALNSAYGELFDNDKSVNSAIITLRKINKGGICSTNGLSSLIHSRALSILGNFG